jgi:hypothetical protein
MTGVSRRARLLFVGAAAVFGAGLMSSLAAGPAPAAPGEGIPVGIRVTGIGLVLLAAWLARYDIARRTIRGQGLTRYMAAALLTGYAWLAVAGVLWAVSGQMADGRGYDAELHAIFLGFVMSMIFAHAPVIIPSVTGRRLPYRPVLYVPLVLLHASLLLRLAGGDWAGNTDAWQWGGSLNEVAILLFLVLAAALVARSGRGRPRKPPPPRIPAAGPAQSAVQHDAPHAQQAGIKEPDTSQATRSSGSAEGNRL